MLWMSDAVCRCWQTLEFEPLKLGSDGPHEMSPPTTSTGSVAAAATLAGLPPTTGRTTRIVVASSDKPTQKGHGRDRPRARRGRSNSVDGRNVSFP